MSEQPFSDFYAVIMAGGGGTRLWPLSRQNKPKQMVNLMDERSLFEIAVDRLQGLFSPDRILVVTVKNQAADLQKICPQILQRNFLLEPYPKGTASVVGLAATVLAHANPRSTMAILTADHFIENEPKFLSLLRSGYLLSQESFLVTLGIQPQYPATGYGYIQRGEQIGEYGNLQAYKAIKFKEKPDEQKAAIFFESRDHYWNSGMFVWKTSTILAEIATQMPDLSAILNQISHSLSDPAWNDDLEKYWQQITPQTIDYGIMENAENVAVIPAQELGWSDVGSWESLFDVFEKSSAGNIIRHGEYLGFDTTNSLVYSDILNKLIVTVGVDDLIIVEVNDALLVCRRSDAQRVRQVVTELAKNEALKKYL